MAGTILALAVGAAPGATVPSGWQVTTKATGVNGPAALAFPPAGSAFPAGLYVAYVDPVDPALGRVARVGGGGALVQLGTFVITFPAGLGPIFRNTPSFDLLFDRPGGFYGGLLLIANGSVLSLAPAGGVAAIYGSASQATFVTASSDAKALVDGLVFGTDGLLRAAEGEGTDDLFLVSPAGTVSLLASRAGASDINNPRLDRAGVYGGGLLFPQLFITTNNDLDEVGGQVVGDALATVLLSTNTLLNPFGAAVGDEDAELGSLLYLSDFGLQSDPGPANDTVFRLLPETVPPTLDPLVTGLDENLRGGHLTIGPGTDGLGSSLYVYESATASVLEIVPPRTGLLMMSGVPSTIASWTAAFAATAYDVIRGSRSSLAQGATSVDLGTTTCIENDSADLTTTGFGDSASPASRQVFFYLYRVETSGSAGDYGRSTKGLPRIPLSGDCPP